MELLADVVPVDLTNVLLAYGPLGAIVMFFGLLVWRFLPKVVDAHIAVMERTGKALETLSENSIEHGKTCKSTLEAVNHLAEAGIAATSDPKVREHLQRVREA